MAFDHDLKIVATAYRAYFCCLDGISPDFGRGYSHSSLSGFTALAVEMEVIDVKEVKVF